ncbi:hypothetical protein DUI87_01888 [Hirundo rustica rustica]|uniref:ribonuclease H n=1 Tax=Hirundo rustica rustica TaxID=333673 RepID=A0A3M0L5U0_HIRRU|nr:hypothetical protein DUI87_01888 [Hirundo rustica rustica]
MLEEFMKNCSLWKRPTVEKFVENCLLWVGPHTEAGKEHEEEEAADTRGTSPDNGPLRLTNDMTQYIIPLDLLEQLEARIIFKNGEISLEGYKNSPTIFGEQLAKDLESWEAPPGEGQLVQYVDDLLIATQTQETCVDWTVSLLNFLGLQGYRVSQKKAQMVRQTVIYLGYERFLKYQAILVEQDDVEIVVTDIVNPASFLSRSMGEPVIHDCLETIEATYSSRPDLKDTLLPWFF